MKKIRLITLVGGLVLGVCAYPQDQVSRAEHIATPTISPLASPSPYTSLANELAAKFLQGGGGTPEQLDAFLTSDEVTGANFQRAVKDAVTAGRKVIADGVPATSKYFPRLLANGDPEYLIIANELAIKFLRGPTIDSPALTAFIATEGVVGTKMTDSVNASVDAVRKLLADGVAAKSKYFSRLLADATGASTPGKTAVWVTPPVVTVSANVGAPKGYENQYQLLAIEATALQSKLAALPSKTGSDTSTNAAIDFKTAEFSEELALNAARQHLYVVQADADGSKSGIEQRQNARLAMAAVQSVQDAIDQRRFGTMGAQEAQEYTDLVATKGVINADIAKQNGIKAQNNDASKSEQVAKSAEAAKRIAVDNQKLILANLTLEKLRAEYEKTSANDAALLAKNDPDAQAKPALDQAKLDAATTGEVALRKQLNLETKVGLSKIQAFFHAGTTLLNPYNITKDDPDKPTALKVQPATSTDAKAFLEFVYANRWAWNTQRINNLLPDPTTCDYKLINLKHFADEWEIDVQTRLGYTFTSSNPSGSDPTTPNVGTANTLVGSGNFNSEILVGLPLVFYRANDDSTDFTVGLVGSYGVVTDRSFLRAHRLKSVGIEYATAFKDPFGAVDADNLERHVLLNFRLTRSAIDTVIPILDDKGIPTGNIEHTNDFLPRFQSKSVWGFETELLYPVNTTTFVSFNGRVYPDASPGQWSVQIGLTASIADILKGFFK